MASPKPKPAPHAGTADTTLAVDEFMLGLEHPKKAEIRAIRSLILGADPSIAEGVKWNAPSFRTIEYFATCNLREKDGIGVILHLGAKVREPGAEPVRVEDPAGLLKWLAKDRAVVVFKDLDDLIARKSAFEAIIRLWIAHVLDPSRPL